MSQSAVSSEGMRPQVQEALVGGVGQEYVQSVLSTTDPAAAVTQIQRQAGLKDPAAPPLLQLLDQLGLTRAEAHCNVLERARTALLARIPSLPPAALLDLLESSFAFVGINDLRAVPLAVLGRLSPVPASYLKQLATDGELFGELPITVQRQVWELDRKLLQAHALAPLVAYTGETATVLRALNMDECLPKHLLEAAAGGGRKPGQPLQRTLPPPPPRKVLRSGSAALQRLVAMVGRSWQVYRGCTELCVQRYRDAEGLYIGVPEAALASLRAQLLMALHDAGATHLTGQEPCHKLAWALDACLNDRVLDDRRLKELQNFFAHHDTGERPSSPRARHRRRPPTAEGDAESAGGPGLSSSFGEHTGRVLGDAAMILRDPSTAHLLAHQVIRQLEAVVAAESSPGDDGSLLFMTRLMQLGADAKRQLKERRFGLPEVDRDIVHTFYPLLAGAIMEADMRSDDEEESPANHHSSGTLEGADDSLVALLKQHEVVRRVTQVFCLERLAAGDLDGAAPLLAALAATLEKLHKGLSEWAPFAATLAARLAHLLARRQVTVGGPLWQLALEQLLLRMVDSETQVHEEVLRLLLAAAPFMEVSVVARYLQTTIQNSRRSRKRFKRKRSDPPFLGGGGPGSGYISSGSLAGHLSPAISLRSYAGGAGSDVECDVKNDAGGPDGVRATYQLFQSRVGGLTEAVAPAYFQYLSTTATS